MHFPMAQEMPRYLFGASFERFGNRRLCFRSLVRIYGFSLKETTMFRFTQFCAVTAAALFLAWSTSDASAQCYQQPFYGGRTGYYHVQQTYYGVPAYRPSVSLNFGTPIQPYYRPNYGRPVYGYGPSYGHGHSNRHGHGHSHGYGGSWGGSGITIRF